MVLALGKALKEANLNTKIYIWDHNRDVMFERASNILNDKRSSVFCLWYSIPLV